MPTYNVWEIWVMQNLPLVFVIAFFGSSIFVWMFNKLIEQKKEFALEKGNLQKEVKEAQDSKLVEKIEALIDQVQFLFSGQREINDDIETIKTDVSALHEQASNHITRCCEREKVLLNIKERQDQSIAKFDKALLHRNGTPEVVNRNDRES